MIKCTFSTQQFALGSMRTLCLVVILALATLKAVQAGVASSPTYYDVNAQTLDELVANSNDYQEQQQQQQPKQSYNKRRRIKGELKRRQLTNEVTNDSVLQEEAMLYQKQNDEEDLDQYLRFLQFSLPVCFFFDSFLIESYPSYHCSS